MVVFDANAILRYILQDNAEMAQLVVDKMEAQTCELPVEVLAEIVYVLRKVYGLERDKIAEAVSGVLDIESISTSERHVVAEGLKVYASTRLDFVDCLLVGYKTVKNYDVFTFDKELLRRLNHM